MAARLVEDDSLRSSATEEDLEEARQKLLDHMGGENEQDDSEWILYGSKSVVWLLMSTVLYLCYEPTTQAPRPSKGMRPGEKLDPGKCFS